MKKLLCAFALLFCLRVSAQAIGTGAYNFAPLESLGFDQINVGNLNVRFNIPLVSRQGRGLPFNYALQYEGLIWNPVTTNNVTTWQNDPDWGFHGQFNGTGFSGSLTYQTLLRSCPRPPNTSGPYISHVNKRVNYVYHDAYGATHLFNYTETDPCPTDSDPDDTVISGDGSSSDGSGYTFITTSGWQVRSRDGKIITPVFAQQSSFNNSITDTNGNQISSTGSTFTDTLGVTALTINGSGTPGSPRTFTYPVTLQADNSRTKSATVSYVNYVVTTNFQCSNIGEVGQDGSFQVNLVDSIQLASGDTYHFTYEATPGYSGRTTGRLASVILPTGGVINYSYSGGCGSARSGINPDGSVGALTRTTTDGVRTYDRAPLSASATSTTVQDEKGNQSYYAFSNDSTNTSVLYKTHRQVYQGTIGNKALLFDEYTCYNGANANCDGAAIAGAISQATVTASYNGGSQSTVISSFSNGQITRQISNGLQTTWNYNALGEVVSTITTSMGSQVAGSSFNYDEGSVTSTSGLPQHGSVSGPRGNLTSTHITGSPNINTSTTYYDTGMPMSSTAVDGGTTSYTYDGTGAFVQATALPTPWSGVALSTSASYDASSASLLSSTGMNGGETTSVNHYDSLLRPIDITLPSGLHIWSDPNVATSVHSMVHQALDSGREELSETLLDSYGRVSRVGQYNGNSVNPWNQVDDCYDASGFLQFQSAAYQSTGEYGPNGPTPKHCSGAGTAYAYDALGRVVSVATQDGTATTLYSNRAVKKTDVNGVSRITQYDLLGRISAVCEISSATLNQVSPSDCGMDIPGTGFLTTYNYDLANHRTQITQGAQVRTFVTDAAGRTMSVAEPESALTSYTYAYNATGLLVTRTRPKANQSNGSVLTTTTTQYDRLGRVINVNYDDSLTPSKWFFYDVTPSTSGWSNPGSNLKGRLAATTADETASNQHAWTHYTYNVAGNVTAMWQCATLTCGTGAQEARPALQFSYDLAGSLMSEYDGTSGNIVYGRSVLEQITSVANQSYTDPTNTPNLVSNVVNGPFGITNWHLGNGTSAVQSFDSSGRLNGGWLCSGTGGDGQSAYCSGSTQLYGYALALSGSRVTCAWDTVTGLCQSHGYDDFNRLTSIVNSNGNFNWAYDRYGNRLSQIGSPSVSSSYDVATNRSTSFGYDAAGNQTNDALHSYTYDGEGKVLSVDNGSTARYVYNALDQRVRAQTASSTYEYVFDPFGRRTSSWILDGTATGFGNEGRIYWDYGLLANRSWNGGTYFHHTNWLGTERVRTNYQGNVSNQQASNPFGDGLTQSSSDSTGAAQDNNQFTSQEQDAESGTIHFQYRQYSSTQGRWMSPDQYGGSYDFVDPQSFNRYSYVGNDPFSWTDPLGLTRPCDGSPADTDGPCIRGGGGAPSGPSLPGTSNPFGNAGTGVAGPTGGAGGGGHAQSTTTRVKKILQCASKVANQYSISGLIDVNEEKHPVLASITSAFLGNTFSGIVDAGTHIGGRQVGATTGDAVLGGYSQGLPVGEGVLAKGVAGITTDAVVNAATNPGAVLSITGAATPLAEEGLAGPAGLAKVGIDGAIFAAATAYCAKQF